MSIKSLQGRILCVELTRDLFAIAKFLLFIVDYPIFSSFLRINVKNFHGSLITVAGAWNDTPKTVNIT